MIRKQTHWIVPNNEMDLIAELLMSHPAYTQLRQGSAINSLFAAMNQAAEQMQAAMQQQQPQPTAQQFQQPNLQMQDMEPGMPQPPLPPRRSQQPRQQPPSQFQQPNPYQNQPQTQFQPQQQPQFGSQALNPYQNPNQPQSGQWSQSLNQNPGQMPSPPRPPQNRIVTRQPSASEVDQESLENQDDQEESEIDSNDLMEEFSDSDF